MPKGATVLKAVVRAVSNAAMHCGMRIVGIKDGFRGLVENRIMSLDNAFVRRASRRAEHLAEAAVTSRTRSSAATASVTAAKTRFAPPRGSGSIASCVPEATARQTTDCRHVGSNAPAAQKHRLPHRRNRCHLRLRLPLWPLRPKPSTGCKPGRRLTSVSSSARLWDTTRMQATAFTWCRNP